MQTTTIARAAAAAALLLLLTGCGNATDADGGAGTTASSEAEAPAETQAPPEPLDLTGEWKQTNSNSETSYQSATITGETIVINWVNVEDSSTALYWVGSYDAPTEDVESYTWDSLNDTSQTQNALMASDAPAKTFTFEGDVLKYELTALGTTMTVEMAKQ